MLFEITQDTQDIYVDVADGTQGWPMEDPSTVAAGG